MCEDSVYTLINDTVINGSTFDWSVTTGGATGTLTSATDVLHPTYTAGDNDLTTVTIELSATGLTPSRGAVCGQIDSTMDITVHQKPEVEAGVDVVNICPGSTFDLNNLATVPSQTNATSFMWYDTVGTAASAGTFGSGSSLLTTYTVAVADEGATVRLRVEATGTVECPVATDFIDITVLDSTLITSPIEVDTICETGTLDLSGVGAFTESNVNTYAWSTTPNEGAFSNADATSATPTYTPSGTPFSDVVLTVDVTGPVVPTFPSGAIGTCHLAQDQINLHISPQAVVDAGVLATPLCGGAPLNFTDITVATTTPTAADYKALLWTEDGAGSMTDPVVLVPEYSPGTNEVGTINFTLTATALTGCTDVMDNVSFTLQAAPSVNAGSDVKICETTPSVNMASKTTPSSASTGVGITYAWTSSTSRGTFSDATVVTPTYTPDPLDFGSTIQLTLTVDNGLGGSCSVVDDEMDLQIVNAATVTVGNDTTICSGATLDLGAHGTVVTNDSTLTWTGNGTFAGSENDFDAVFTPDVSTYGNTITLSIAVTPQTPCAVENESFDLTISDAPEVTLQTQAVCEGSDLDLSTLIATAPSKVTAAATYTWANVTGTGTIDNLIATSTDGTYGAVTADAGQTRRVSLTIVEPTAAAACQSQDFEVDITIDAIPTLAIDGPYDICVGETFTIPASDIVATPSSVSLTWVTTGMAGTDAGNESYTAVAGDAGNIVTLTATTGANGQCSGVSSATTIDVHGSPVPSIFGSAQVCANSVSGYVVPSAPANSSYDWSTAPVLGVTEFDKLSTDDSARVDFTGATGTVVLSVEMTDQFTCKGTASLNIDIVPDFTPGFTLNEPSGCTGENMVFTLDNISPNSTNNSFTWYLNDELGTPLQTGNGTTFTTNTLTPGQRIIARLTVDPALNCVSATTPASAYVQWSNPTINTQPATPNLTGGGVVCYPNPTQVSDADAVVASRKEWFINTSTTPVVAGTDQFNESLDEGSYTLRYEVANGPCSASATIPVIVDRAAVEASATATSLEEGSSSILSSKHNTLNQLYSYVWENVSHDEVIPAFDQKNDVVVLPLESTTTYRVTATTSNGCVAVDEVPINVFVICEPENVFTPNGDGDNDTWVVDCLNDGSFPQAVLTVYNRWGDVVYRDGNGYIEPWDGTRNGIPMPVATYWWVLEYNKLNIPPAYGDVTILR